MKIKNNLLILSIPFLLFVSCGKDGATGPQGPAGATGAAGAVGPAGKDGSQIYAGNGVPSASLGNTGDYYLDESADNLYGPKTSTGWGPSLSLKGATGAAGVAGNKILSGSGTPAATIGGIGDYYLDETSYLLYGPKTSAGWGGGLLLKGKDGNQFVNDYVFKNVTVNMASNSLGYYGEFSLNVPVITTSVISQGAVLLYTDYFYANHAALAGNWVMLPYIIPNQLYIAPYLVEAAGANNNVSIDVISPTAPMTSITADFEVVVIQGASVTQLNAANPNVNFNDYKQVASLFHLNK